MKKLSISDLRRDITGSSSNTGREFGTLGRFPIVDELSGYAKYKCGNEDCPAREVRFDYVVNRIRGDIEAIYNWDRFEFDWDPNLDEFRVTGHYCPICDRLEIRVDDEIVEQEDGKI